MTIVAELVGAPFVPKGRDRKGLDCWGVVWLGHRLAGNDLPRHAAVSFDQFSDVATLIGGSAAEGPWRRIERGCERALDVAVLWAVVKSGGVWVRLNCHVGLVTAPGMLLHCEEKTGTVHVPFAHPTISRRIVSIHRHAAVGSAAGEAFA